MGQAGLRPRRAGSGGSTESTSPHPSGRFHIGAGCDYTAAGKSRDGGFSRRAPRTLRATGIVALGASDDWWLGIHPHHLPSADRNTIAAFPASSTNGWLTISMPPA